jgi:hypothetical protein
MQAGDAHGLSNEFDGFSFSPKSTRSGARSAHRAPPLQSLSFI